MWFRIVSVTAYFTLCCSQQETQKWWETTNIYQVYVISFFDTDGNGYGDLKGIIEKVNYLKEIGVDTVWLSPIYKSPLVDLGYDISNFTEIEPLFGNMQDFEVLTACLKKLGMNILLDFVPNHTSNLHPWFLASEDPCHPLYNDYKDFYTWVNPRSWNGTIPNPPNNWLSRVSGGAWEWSPKRQQFYLHQFAAQQPDLNYRNPLVVGNMTNILKFWLDKGIDGFRVDAVPFLYEDSRLLDEPVAVTPANPLYQSTEGYFSSVHIYTNNQPETYNLLEQWAEVLYQYSLKDKKDKLFILEIQQDIKTTQTYYGKNNHDFMFPFNFYLEFNINQSSCATDFFRWITIWYNYLPKNRVANWVTGNHDNPRVPSYAGPENVDVMNMLSSILTGVKVTYYGEEIGMSDADVRPEEGRNSSTDGSRTPMQWNDCPSAGFSTNLRTWLPVNPNYWYVNVAAEQSAPSSHLKVYQAMTQARKDPVLQRGDLYITAPDNDTLVVVRSYQKSSFVLIYNAGSYQNVLNSNNFFKAHDIDEDMVVVAASINSGYPFGYLFRGGCITLSLRPRAAVVLRNLQSSNSFPSPSCS